MAKDEGLLLGDAARAIGVTGESLDLTTRDAPAVGLVARRAQLARALPAPERVRANAYGAGGVAQQKSFFGRHMPKHCIGRNASAPAHANCLRSSLASHERR